MKTVLSNRSLACFAMIFATVLSGCGNRSDSVGPLAASAIVITAPDGSIPVTGTMQFVSTVTDANGNTLTTTPTYTVINGGGTITSDGLFTAGDSVGTFVNTIVARIGSVADTTTVTVSAGGLANITVSPAFDTTAVDATQQFTATGTDAFGHAVDIPPGLVWSLNSATAGTVDSTGHFSAGSVAGTYTLTATSGTVVGHASILIVAGPLATITVSPNPDTLAQLGTQQFTAVGKDVHNNVVAIVPTWSADTGGVITPTGLYTAGIVAGTFTSSVHATVGSIVGSATVTVQPGALASILVTPPLANLLSGMSVPFTAIGRDANGNVVPVTVVWSIAPARAGAGTISSTGLFSAGFTNGNYPNAIVATSGSIVGTASVTVFNPICLPLCGGGGIP